MAGMTNLRRGLRLTALIFLGLLTTLVAACEPPPLPQGTSCLAPLGSTCGGAGQACCYSEATGCGAEAGDHYYCTGGLACSAQGPSGTCAE